MSFPEKLQVVFDKYGTTELKIYTLLNLYDDVVDLYTEDQKAKDEEIEAQREIMKNSVPYLNELSKLKVKEKERKQKLQELLPHPDYSIDDYGDVCYDGKAIREWFKKFEKLLKE